MLNRKQREVIKTKCLEFAISKDETRLQLCGVSHVENIESLCSTNGHCATILKSRYCEALKNVVIDTKTFQAIDREYPKISQVIPDIKKGSIYKLDMKSYFYNKACLKDFTKIHLYKEGHCLTSDESYLTFEYRKEDEENYLCSFNSSFFKTIAKDCTIKLAFFKELSPVLFDLNSIDSSDSDDFKDVFLVMPIKFNKGE